jgi:hypothetical protein
VKLAKKPIYPQWRSMIVAIACTVLLQVSCMAPRTVVVQTNAPAAMAQPTVYLAAVSALLARDWPTNRTVNIVCHGHSVVAGYFETPVVETFNAYPHLLHRGLNERFPHAVINVIVTAIGGENSEQGAQRFERCAVPAAGCRDD